MTWFTRKSDRSLGETLCTETKDKVGEKNLLSKRASSEVYLVYPCFEPVAIYASLKISLPSLKSLADSTWVFGRPDVNVWQTWQRTFHRGVCSSHRTVELCFGVGVCSFDCCHALDLAASPVPISIMIPIYMFEIAKLWYITMYKGKKVEGIMILCSPFCSIRYYSLVHHYYVLSNLYMKCFRNLEFPFYYWMC